MFFYGTYTFRVEIQMSITGIQDFRRIKETEWTR